MPIKTQRRAAFLDEVLSRPQDIFRVDGYRGLILMPLYSWLTSDISQDVHIISKLRKSRHRISSIYFAAIHD